ncbi:pyridoxamine 5'-phosphate oxidase family protein [Streptomyces sp. SCSIO 30461]|uniref:pyridoxamine 5'-phosphate oxidase family protein n=1 Tax=Streptomyces sp. SCSIO 30461 TaxID=3118085 RepID=UPI0030D3650C
MTSTDPARSRSRRKQDALNHLAHDEDAWVATASPSGEACLVPLSFIWDRGTLLMATRRTNPTAVNLSLRASAVVALGHTRDVVHIEGTAELVEGSDLAKEAADRFAAKLGWDPRGRKPWVYISFTPVVVKAWREANEQPGRLLMREGQWLDGP